MIDIDAMVTALNAYVSVKDKLISTLATLTYPVMLQGSIAKDEAYPSSFFTFWNNNTEDLNHYENLPIAYEWDFDVNFYSNDPDLVETVLISAKTALQGAGFIIDGKGHDLPTDVITHTGRGMTVKYREESEEIT